MAILLDAAIRWAKAQGSPEALRDAVCQRLLAADAAPVGDGRLDEFPEDVVTELLEAQDLDLETQEFAAAGWDDARRETERLLTDPALADEVRESLITPFIRVYRVAELSESPHLRPGVRAALHLAMECPDIDTGLLQQVVQAAMSYLSDSDGPTFNLLLEREAIAGYAFLALVRADANSPEIADIFLRLMERQYLEGWDIDVWFLGEHVRSYAENMNPVRDAIEAFRAAHPDIWKQVESAEKENPCWPADIVASMKPVPRAEKTRYPTGHAAEAAPKTRESGD